MQADAVEHLAYRRTIRRHAYVACQGEIRAASSSRAVDGRDDRLGGGHNRGNRTRAVVNELTRFRPVVRLDQLLQVPDVGARAEGTTGAGEDDDAAVAIQSGILDRVAKIGGQWCVERVERVRPVQRDRGDVRVALDEKCRCHAADYLTGGVRLWEDRLTADYDSAVNEYVSIDGARLECVWHGPSPAHAPTLVFLHEGLGSISQWRDFPAALCSRTGCGGLVYSRRGHGRSDAFMGPRSVRFMHDEALLLPRLLRMFEIARPILVGHSDGASIALIYAGSGLGHPLALVLEAPHVFVEEITSTRIAELRDLYATTDLRTKLARHHGPNVDTLFHYWTDVWLRPEFHAWNIEEYLANIECPVLVIQGKDDEYGTKRQVDSIVSVLGDRCDALMLAACRHSPHVDQRAIVETTMARFIRDLGSLIPDP